MRVATLVALGACGAPIAPREPVAHAPRATAAAAGPGGCLSPDAEIQLDLTRLDGRLVACEVRDYSRELVACWDVEVATGVLHARAAKAPPGYDRRADGSPDAANVVTNRDTGQTAVVTQDDLELFDVHGASLSRRPLRTTGTSGELTNSVEDVYFVGNTVYILGHDSGPFAALFVYPLGQPPTPALTGLEGGAVSVGDHELLVQEDALSRLTVIDARGRRTIEERHVGRPGCAFDETYAYDHSRQEGAGSNACDRELDDDFGPYVNAVIARDAAGTGFVGVAPHSHEVFALDHDLRETSRASIAVCPRD